MNQPFSLPRIVQTPLHAQDHGEEPEENWILSYLDVFALIATLFIVLTVMAQLKLEKSQEQQSQQQQTLQQTQTELVQTQQQLAALTTPRGDAAIETLPNSFQALVAEQGWSNAVIVNSHDDYTELQIRDHVLFLSAEAELLPEGNALLARLIPLLQQSPDMIYIEGHTDNQPIDTLRFHSNWELAAARATNVLQYFASNGIPGKRLRAVSVADTDPVASNATEAGRAQNRRVSLLLRKVEANELKVAEHRLAVPAQTLH